MCENYVTASVTTDYPVTASIPTENTSTASVPTDNLVTAYVPTENYVTASVPTDYPVTASVPTKNPVSDPKFVSINQGGQTKWATNENKILTEISIANEKNKMTAIVYKKKT